MTFKAKFVQDGRSIDHTPASAVAAGDIVVIGTNFITVAKLAIAANELGAVATEGVFDFVKDNSDLSAGDPFYWDADGDPVGGTAGSGAMTGNAANGPFAGWVLEDAGVGVGTFRGKLASLEDQDTVTRAELVQDDLQPYPIDFTALRVWNARHTLLPATAADDDMALITGTFGTDAPTLQGVDFGGASTDEKAAFTFILPPEYVDGQTITLRIKAAMLTTVSDGTATVDVQVHKRDANGAVGADLCATAAQSINSLTPANKDFTITPTGLVAGDVLEVRVEFGGSDTGNAGVMIPEISDIRFLLDIKG